MKRITVLTGGVGGAKLALGLALALDDGELTAIVNTGDDFDHLGLRIAPDLDTLLYTLSGKANVEQGWGRAGESWAFMAALRSIGGPGWFALGDGDLALHVARTDALARDIPLSSIVTGFAAAWDVGARLLPMTDDRIATIVDTDDGELPFQDYFVARRCEPRVRAIRFDGARDSRPAPGVIEAIEHADAVIVAPSNPYLSLDPILAVPGIRATLRDTSAPVVAVSPVRGGESFKGPTAKIMQELGVAVESATVADRYADFIDAIVVDDNDTLVRPGLKVVRADIAMPTPERKLALARTALEAAGQLRSS